MKQVININFQGRVVPIEVTAFDTLKKYTESLNRYFAEEEGKEEIINDIENRIGELFQERLSKGATCITDEDVQAIITSMGRPEDFESDQSASAGFTSTEQTATPNYAAAGTARRLYRDENHKMIGGVCSGLANYFGIDVKVVRILFIIFAIFGAGFVAYLILWVAVPSSSTTQIGSIRKKLYRDPDDKFIAGVCSGIGNYFGVSSWIPRVLFLLPFLSFVSSWNHWGFNDFGDFMRISFSPGSLLIYVILWLVLPEATTTTEKLEMKGEKVDMNSIKNSVMEEIKGVQQRAEKFGREAAARAGERTSAVASDTIYAARRGSRSLGDIIAFIFKAFLYFIMGCIGFALVVALFGFGIAAIGLFPLKDFVLTDGWQNALAWGTLIFFIAAPIIGIITWVIRRLAKIKSNRKLMRVSFMGLWLLGAACFIGLISLLSKDFRSTSSLNEQEVVLSNPGVSKLEVSNRVNSRTSFRTRWLQFSPFENPDEDTVYVNNISIHIMKSTTDSFRVTVMKLANGRNRRAADTLASTIDFSAQQTDSLLQISKGIAINRRDKFRNQRVILTIYVPVGKQIRIDDRDGWNNNVHFGIADRADWDIDFSGEETGWDEGVDYIMTKDGLYTLKGKPADEWKHRNDLRDNDNDENTDNDEDGINSGSNTYRYDTSKPMNALDSLKIRLQREEIRTRDSLKKVKEQVDEQLRRINRKAGEPTAANDLNNYILPTYNPMALMF